jgi:hypothetical protein
MKVFAFFPRGADDRTKAFGEQNVHAFQGLHG